MILKLSSLVDESAQLMGKKEFDGLKAEVFALRNQINLRPVVRYAFKFNLKQPLQNQTYHTSSFYCYSIQWSLGFKIERNKNRKKYLGVYLNCENDFKQNNYKKIKTNYELRILNLKTKNEDKIENYSYSFNKRSGKFERLI